MGTFNKGILGAFSGKVGPVVGSSWRGKDVLRSLPRKSNKPASPAQQLQRDKFLTVTQFLNPLQPVVRRYFGSNTGDRTRRNQAMAYLMQEAVILVNNQWQWQYNKVLISRGDLLGFNNAEAVAQGNLELKLTWLDNAGQGEAQPTDKLVVVVYEPISKMMGIWLDAASRNDAAVVLAMPDFMSGLSVQVWATWASQDDKQYATSLYLGAVTITP